MRPLLWALVVVIVFVATVLAQPQIAANGGLNAASNAPPLYTPNSSIAQGSSFTIYGTNLGPSSSPALAFPCRLGLVACRFRSVQETRRRMLFRFLSAQTK